MTLVTLQSSELLARKLLRRNPKHINIYRMANAAKDIDVMCSSIIKCDSKTFLMVQVHKVAKPFP